MINKKFLIISLILLSLSSAYCQQNISINVNDEGRIFEGIGALSAGASSRLLIDYPEPERSVILDLLFKPYYGASLHHLKIEVGGEVNSTDGTEPTHARTRDEMLNPKPEYFYRGYEWWLAKEALKRNPQIKIEVLAWGAPGWVGNGNFYSQDMADYYVSYIKGMKNYHGVDVSYLGIWNETPYEISWIKLLRKTLDDNELKDVQIVAADQVPHLAWKIADDIEGDIELSKAVSVIGDHYPERIKGKEYQSSKAAIASGKPIWNAEGGPWKGGWNVFPYFAKMYNRCYIEGKMTKTITWSLVSSYYDNLSIPSSGPMRANAPWCGYFEIQPCLWAMAHTAQFVQPGWRYFENGCGYLEGKGSFVTLCSSGKQKDISIIIETMDADKEQNITFGFNEDVLAKPVSVWRSIQNKSVFEKQDEIKVKDGKLKINLEPKALYSLTTTEWQKKGQPESPEYDIFPIPYKTDFEDEKLARSPKYLSDISGVFEIVMRPDDQGKCLRQVVDRKNIFWHSAKPRGEKAFNSTILGDRKWSNYRLSVDVYLEGQGTVTVLGKLGSMRRATLPPNGYWFEADSSGKWTLYAQEHELATGSLYFPEKVWHQIEVDFADDYIVVYVNQSEICNVKLDKAGQENKVPRYRNGLAGIGSGYNCVLYDNLSIDNICK